MAKKKNKDASFGNHAAKGDSNIKTIELGKKTKGEGSDANALSNDASTSHTTQQLPLIGEEGAQTIRAINPAHAPYSNAQAGGSSFVPPEAKRKGKGLKVFGIVVASILLFMLVVYGAGCLLFMDRFFPNTTIGTHDVSMRTTAECAPGFDETAGDYTLSVEGEGLNFSFTAQEIDMAFDGEKIAKEAHSHLAVWKWPLELHKKHDLSEYFVASYDKRIVRNEITSLVGEFNVTATPPQDAIPVYDAATKKFKISPEKPGTTVSAEALLSKIDDAITAFIPKVIISDEELEKAKILSTDDALKEACKIADTMIKADMSLLASGIEVAALSPEVQSAWVVFGPDLSVTFNEEAFSQWTEEIIKSLNTVGTKRTYTRPDGKVITVSGGSYGWEVDSDLLRAQLKEGMAAGTVGVYEIPVLQAGSGFAALGGQDWGLRYCDIDLSEQYARFYDGTGALVWESALISGSPDGVHGTPSGAYMLNLKESPSKLIGEIDPKTKKPEYETMVTYWMPFVGNAVGLHDATWQPGFGGAMYAEGFGSHGCVNLPYDAAEALYGIIQVGDPVICHW